MHNMHELITKEFLSRKTEKRKRKSDGLLESEDEELVYALGTGSSSTGVHPFNV